MVYKLKEYVKSHKWVYYSYFYVMSFLINLLGKFVKTDENLILFVSYGGKHFSDSPKCIYEELLNDNRFLDFKFVWGFVNPDDFEVGKAIKVKIDTLRYFITALKARVWVTNVTIERALKFKGKRTFYLNTAHGTPLKGKKSDGQAFQVAYKCFFDCLLAQSEFDKSIAQIEFDLPPEKIHILGYPRNDKFAKDLSPIIKKVRDYYSIPDEKKILLYAPTYRDWNNGVERLNVDLKKWERTIGDRYVFLFRAHPTVKFTSELGDNAFFKNATSYEDLDELLIAADVLISDYSSLFFDYSIMHKPMICWAYDYAKFSRDRELRVDLVHEVYGGEINEDDVLSYIDNGDFMESLKMVKNFQKKYVTEYGHAAKNAVEMIYKTIR